MQIMIKNKINFQHGMNTLLLATVLLFSHCNSDLPSKSQLEKEFKNPPNENRALALWPWLNGYVDTTKLVYELEQMKDKGMRGAVVWDIGALADPDKMIPEGPSFLGDKSLEYFSLALKTSKKLDLDLGMVASSSWNAGGEWIDKADASMQLLSSSQTVEGPSIKKIKIGKPESSLGEPERYSLISSIAIPYSESKMIDNIEESAIALDEFTTEYNPLLKSGLIGKAEIFCTKEL